jgi:hypothetical protein
MPAIIPPVICGRGDAVLDAALAVDGPAEGKGFNSEVELVVDDDTKLAVARIRSIGENVSELAAGRLLLKSWYVEFNTDVLMLRKMFGCL